MYKYWRAVLRYGHVKKGKEVSVARYIQSEPEFGIVDVMNLVQNMQALRTEARCVSKESTRQHLREASWKSKITSIC